MHFPRRCNQDVACLDRDPLAAWTFTQYRGRQHLRHYARQAAQNAPLFLEAFYDACEAFRDDDPDVFSPDVTMINDLLARHSIGYQIRVPRLELRDAAASAPLVAVEAPPATLTERAAGVLAQSLDRSEELLRQGRYREAVQESLWLLESIATAFRGIETASGTIEGGYFNRIARELGQAAGRGTTLERALAWVTAVHGYLSSPTGGGVRHGLTQTQDARNFPSAEAFAAELTRRLQEQIERIPLANPLDRGIGLHFTAYEHVDDRWIPELFLVSNWRDPTYTALRDTGVGWSRETLKTLDGREWQPDDRRPDLRVFVSQFLHGEGVYRDRGQGLFRYNNGDPLLYNPTAEAIQKMLATVAERRVLKELGVRESIQLACIPVETVSRVQRDFYRPGYRVGWQRS